MLGFLPESHNHTRVRTELHNNTSKKVDDLGVPLLSAPTKGRG
jgi:hypothetical protein